MTIMNNVDSLYQYGTLALLVPGLFEGNLSLTDLLSHGDTGIGTGDGLDGELIILDGIAYQVDGDGNVNEVKDDFTVPFANVHQGAFKPLTDVDASLNAAAFEKKVLDATKWENTFFSVKAHGKFKFAQTRSINKQPKPYPGLVECANNQSVFKKEDVEGTIIGYYSPQIFNGAAVGGFHLHFLADDHSMGGHVMDFEMQSGNIAVQQFSKLEQELPVNNQDYMDHDFSKDDIQKAIGEAE